MSKTKSEEGRMVAVRMSVALCRRIEAYEKRLRATADASTFSDALRRLVIAGLAVEEARS